MKELGRALWRGLELPIVEIPTVEKWAPGTQSSSRRDGREGMLLRED